MINTPSKFVRRVVFNKASAGSKRIFYIITIQAAVNTVQPVSGDVCFTFKMHININNRMQLIWRKKKWPLGGLKAMLYAATYVSVTKLVGNGQDCLLCDA